MFHWVNNLTTSNIHPWMNPKTCFVKFGKVINHIMYLNIYQLLQWLPLVNIEYEECTHFWKENAGGIESSWCTQVELEPGHGARLAMFSARFNEKNKEACIAVVTRIHSLKFFGIHKQCGTRTFKNLPIEVSFQLEAAVGSWGHRK